MRPYIVILFSLLPFFSNAAALPSIKDFIKQAEVIKVNAVNSATSTMIKVSTTVRGFAANDPYMVKNLDVPKANFLSHAKNNMGSLVKRNAWYAAWFATMAAAGWAIDELTNQVTSTKFIPKGGCYIYGYFKGANHTPESCGKLVYLDQSIKFQSITLTSSPDGVGIVGTMSRYQVVHKSPTNQILVNDIGLSWSSSTSEVNPVPDDALYDSLISHMLQDPKAASQAFMVPDAWPYPYPQIFPETVPYIPGVAEADQEALDWYYRGLLQSNNPNAPYYVTPERHQQIAALASQLQQGITPEGDAAALNDQLKKPITQKQLEETLKKEKEAEAKADQEAAAKAQEALAPADTALDKLNEEKKWFEDAIKDSANQAPPSQGLSLPKWTWPVGSCKPFPITFSISNLSAKANDGGAFCDNYNNVYHPLIYWFLYMLLALYLFVLWNRTMVQVLGSR